MTSRNWWRNCASKSDAEIQHIDRMEDRLSPIPPNVSGIRELISSLELCHHKAGRWVQNIIEAIGSEHTTKGLGTRPPNQTHPAEQVWQSACDALSAWGAGCPIASLDLSVGQLPASQLLAGLGPRTPLKEWQVHRVVERIREFVGWVRSKNKAPQTYVPLLECGSDYESARRTERPARYLEHSDYWLQTVQTSICDTEDGTPAELSLAVAIDMLMPCHWNFVQNLQIVLGAIGGNLNPHNPFAACARNIRLSPIRQQMKTLCRSLRAFCGSGPQADDMDAGLLDLFGGPSATKKWLAASLEKTIRLQLHL